MVQILAKKIKIKNIVTLTIFLWQISEIKQGLATGDNKYYLYKKPETKGPYKIVDHSKILFENELQKISKDEDLRKEIVQNGISKNLFKGRTIVPLDKGGSSDVDEKRLSNYYAPTKHFIDWSTKNVNRLKTLTIAQRKISENNKNITESDKKKIASRFQNVEYYFLPGITFPMVGIPTFSLNSNSIFDHGGNCLFIKKGYRKFFSNEYLLGILCSKFTTYIINNYINNTVNTQVNDMKKIPIPICSLDYKNKIEILVKSIIKNQKKDLNYSYQKNEQSSIDDLVYEIFGLDNNLIDEINNWYSRKYPYLRKSD